ncbi:hypothetical protein D3C80_1406100 [compost metagenome]
MAKGSVVGSPLASTPMPSGSCWPARAAICTSPWAMALVAMSKTIGSCSAQGAANAMGLVPNSGLRAPCGTTQVMLLTTLRATRPSSANGSTSGHSAAKWCELWIASTAIPALRALATNSSRAAANAGWAKPPAASTRT